MKLTIQKPDIVALVAYAAQRKGLIIASPSTWRPWLMSSDSNSRQPSARAAAMIALSQ